MIEEPIIKRIAIVGLGPKGLYGLERLLANLSEVANLNPIEIHLFNSSESFGAGAIYNPKQPSYLKMNYVNGYIDMWAGQKPHPVIPFPQSFAEWLTEHREEFPEANSYTVSARATVGKYLTEGFQELLNNCPENVTIYKHVGEVVDLDKVENNYTIYYRDQLDQSKKEIAGFENILIATGHPCVNDQGDYSHENYVDFIYPVEQKLNFIPSGSKVAIKGMGLTFIDAVLALTEGRNGKFEKDDEGKLSYITSGREPEIIYPFSKSGLMMIPRGNTFGSPAYEPFYFRKESFEFVEAMEGKYDFERQLLPLIEQEFTAVYYSKLFAKEGLELELSKDFSKVLLQIEDFHELHPDTEQFDFHNLLDKPIEGKDLNASTLQYIQKSIEEAEIGEGKSALAAVASLWRHLSDFFNELYKFGGLKPQSQKIFLEKYAGHLNRISYGPPIENMKKIEAVAKAGLIDFSFCQSPEITKTTTYWQATIEQRKIYLDCLVDARIPKIQLHRCAGELYGNLLEKELISPYVNRLEGHLDYRPGCLAINEKGNPVGPTGDPNPSITFTGTPTEGLTYDNDTLSRKRNDFVSEWAKNLSTNLHSINSESQLIFQPTDV